MGLGDTGGGDFFPVGTMGSSYSTDPCCITVRGTVVGWCLVFPVVWYICPFGSGRRQYHDCLIYMQSN